MRVGGEEGGGVGEGRRRLARSKVGRKGMWGWRA